MVIKPEKQHFIVPSAEIAKVSLPNGWRGIVSLRDQHGESLAVEQWLAIMQNLPVLKANGHNRLKMDRLVDVTQTELVFGNTPLRVVVKHIRAGNNIEGFCRSLEVSKACRNFCTAMKLIKHGVPTAYPLAAVERRAGPSTRECIFITEYIDESACLANFMHDNCGNVAEDADLKQRLSSQIASILAQMHLCGLWHRDAKGGNFLVEMRKDDGPRVLLVDMDGIKKYGVRREECRWRPFVKLGATMMANPAIYMSDYLRTFRIYCKFTGLSRDEMKARFRKIVREAVSLRLLTAAKTAMQQSKLRQ